MTNQNYSSCEQQGPEDVLSSCFRHSICHLRCANRQRLCSSLQAFIVPMPSLLLHWHSASHSKPQQANKQTQASSQGLWCSGHPLSGGSSQWLRNLTSTSGSATAFASSNSDIVGGKACGAEAGGRQRRGVRKEGHEKITRNGVYTNSK